MRTNFRKILVDFCCSDIVAKSLKKLFDPHFDVEIMIAFAREYGYKLEFKDVDFSYVKDNDKLCLKNINLSIKSGETVGILGGTGSGKTTLLKVLGMIDRPTAGTMFFKEREIKKLWDEELSDIRRREVGFVFQDFTYHLVYGIFLSADLPCVMRTIKRTFAAKLAFFKRVGAFFYAPSASGTFVFIKHHLGLRGLAFGIVTPRATQITSLEEHGRSYSGPVNVGIAFYIKNSSSKHGYSSIGQIVIV